MRKRLIRLGDSVEAESEQWLDLALLAEVEITSEASGFPIEAALAGEDQSLGWKAAHPGEQLIRLLFDQPQRLTRIALEFDEPTVARTQEFLLLWSSDGNSYHEIVRQQWNFSPNSSPREYEDYKVDLAEVSVLELRIVPDISLGQAIATLKRLRLRT